MAKKTKTKKPARKPAKKSAQSRVKKAARKPAKKAAKKANPASRKTAKRTARKTRKATKPARKAIKRPVAKKAKTTVKRPAPNAPRPAPLPARLVSAPALANKPGPVATVAPGLVPKVELSKGSDPILLHHRQPTEKESVEFRKALMLRRAQLMSDVEHMEEEAFSAEGREVSGNHLAESSSAQYEQDFTLHMIENESSELGMIQRAVDKIDGRLKMPFGRCESCGIWISVERLKAKPFARICIHCVGKFERDGGGEEFGVVADRHDY